MEATLDRPIDAAAKKPKRDRRMHTSTVRVFLASFVLLVFVFTFTYTKAWGEWADRLAEESSTDVFSTMDLQTLDGEHFTAEDLKGSRITLFNVWGTNCPPCIRELPELEALSKSYAPGEIQVVGILSDSMSSEGEVMEGHLDDARMYMENSGATFPTLILDQRTYAFIMSTLIGTPTTFIVDSEGNVIRTVVGGNDLAGWKTIVDEVLSGL